MDDSNTYSQVQYTVEPKSGENNAIKAIINNNEQFTFIPFSSGNRHYAEIMRKVDAGELTIADAD